MAESGKIAIDWHKTDDTDPPTFGWSMTSNPGLSLEELVALCEQMAAAHRELLGEG
jgi:hypothetical protein